MLRSEDNMSGKRQRTLDFFINSKSAKRSSGRASVENTIESEEQVCSLHCLSGLPQKYFLDVEFVFIYLKYFVFMLLNCCDRLGTSLQSRSSFHIHMDSRTTRYLETGDFLDMAYSTKNVYFIPCNQYPWWTSPAQPGHDAILRVIF